MFNVRVIISEIHFCASVKEKNVLSINFIFSRVIKTSMELDVLRYANKVSSAAHIAVMKAVRPGEF